MNEYEARQEQRRQRFAELAAKAQAQSAAAHDQSVRMMSVIPMGQPILVGHHSEGRDRRYRDRAWNKMEKAVELQKKAEYYQQRAAAVDGNGAISSDDPEAIVKLREELGKKEARQSLMKAANAIIRKKGKTQAEKVAEIVATCNVKQTTAEAFFTPDCFGGIGFASYQLTNNNANIRRIQERIKALERQHAQAAEQQDKGEPDTIQGNGYTVRFDAAENRVMFEFPGKPDAETRGVLKSNGFKWSPTRGAWVRFLASGRLPAKWVMEHLDKQPANT